MTTGISCPSCEHRVSTVRDAARPRVMEGIQIIRRRRACCQCDLRFTTLELAEADLKDLIYELVAKATA